MGRREAQGVTQGADYYETNCECKTPVGKENTYSVEPLTQQGRTNSLQFSEDI